MNYTFKVYSFFNLLMCLLVWITLIGGCLMISNGSVLMEADLLSSSILNLNIPFMVDMYSAIFSITVIMISGCVMYYNGFYMDSEVFYSRFCKLVLLFVLSMFFLIMIPNLLGLMIGWDGLGITSYLLVIYYQDKRSLGSGTLTVLSNRVGDVLFFIAIALCSSLSSWSFLDISMGWYISGLCGVIIVGCMTKSAQMPFSAWLPAAMAAPSPVSALVHSSTLVTAGVYVLVRFSGSIHSGWYLFLGVVSSLTMFMSAISAVFEPDVKKVVALSTLSQLGVMMLALSAGAISVASFSLMGFPFLSGFFSKDLVIESFLSGGISMVLCLMVVLSTCLTGVYSGLLVLSVTSSSMSNSYMGSMNSTSYITFPCSILGVGALGGGYFMQTTVLDFNTVFSLYGNMKMIPFLCFITGVVTVIFYSLSLLGMSYNVVNAHFNSKGLELYYDMAAKMWFMPPLSSDMFSTQVLSLSGDMKSVVEDGYLEYSFGSDSVWKVGNQVSSFYMNTQSDYLGLSFIKGFIFLLSVILMFMSVSM
uniref:NADH-ubiquinone oxidoreductase chain 5 n=1 Tax=Scrobicularia plana TaxID=665965 RepID=A0A6H2U251_9BIVA|nr:NADH dehydrogenase subunit 5 [Scrobicularia plana]